MKAPEALPKLRLVSAQNAAGDLPSHDSTALDTSPDSRVAGRFVAALPLSALAERDDGELVALAQAGESAAFEALYRRHSPYVMALAVRVQGNPTDVEDVVHDAFLKVHDRLDDLRSGASFRPWLASVVVSLLRTRLRRRRFLGYLGVSKDDPIDLDALATPGAGPEVRAQLAQVYGILRSVSVDKNICWTLRYVEGRKLEEVAELAGCSLATAKRRIASVQELILLTNRHDATTDTERREPLANEKGEE